MRALIEGSLPGGNIAPMRVHVQRLFVPLRDIQGYFRIAVAACLLLRSL